MVCVCVCVGIRFSLCAFVAEGKTRFCQTIFVRRLATLLRYIRANHRQDQSSVCIYSVYVTVFARKIRIGRVDPRAPVSLPK